MRAELNKENIKRALTGLVSLFIVLLKLINRIKTNIAIAIGNNGIRIDIFMEFPTK